MTCLIRVKWDCNHTCHSTLQSAEPSLQHQTPATVATQEEKPTSKTQPQDDGELKTNPPPATIPSDLSPEKPNPRTEGPAEKGQPFEERENGTIGFTFTPGDFGLYTGSGMLPPGPEEDGASPTEVVGNTAEETQSTAEPEAEDGRTECKGNTSKNL